MGGTGPCWTSGGLQTFFHPVRLTWPGQQPRGHAGPLCHWPPESLVPTVGVLGRLPTLRPSFSSIGFKDLAPSPRSDQLRCLSQKSQFASLSLSVAMCEMGVRDSLISVHSDHKTSCPPGVLAGPDCGASWRVGRTFTLLKQRRAFPLAFLGL